MTELSLTEKFPSNNEISLKPTLTEIILLTV